MSTPTPELKRSARELRRAQLIEEYEKNETQLRNATSSVERSRLENLSEELERQLEDIEKQLVDGFDQPSPQVQSPHPIYVAVIAMTTIQAIELASGEVFDGSKNESQDCKCMQEFREALREHGIDDFTTYYGEEADLWKPPLAGGELTIRQILGEISCRRANIRLESKSTDLLELSHTDTCAYFTMHGGIIIVDALSLYHPKIKDLFNSLQTSHPKDSSAMIVLAPLPGADAMKANKLLETHFYTTSLLRHQFGEKWDKRLDLRYEFWVHDQYALRRWLYNILPPAVREKPLAAALEAAEQEAENKPKRIHDFYMPEAQE